MVIDKWLIFYSVPGPNEVLVKVAAAGLNPKDWKVCHLLPRFPSDVFHMGLTSTR